MWDMRHTWRAGTGIGKRDLWPRILHLREDNNLLYWTCNCESISEENVTQIAG
jgi:hypothetical protein